MWKKNLLKLFKKSFEIPEKNMLDRYDFDGS